jgi:hypothetical protein
MSSPPIVIEQAGGAEPPGEALPPLSRRLLGGAAVIAYLLIWVVVRHRFNVRYGLMFGHLVDAAFLVPVLVLIRTAGPAIGHRRSAWWLLFVPIFNLLVVSAVIYRLAILPHKPWSGTLLPHAWTRAVKLSVAAGVVITLLAMAYSLPQQNWPLEQTLDDAVANRLDASNRSPRSSTSRLLMVFDRGDEAVALVETVENGDDPIFRAWWFQPVRSWWRNGWRLDTDSVAGARSVVGIPQCSDDFHDWCRVGLPQVATGFVIQFENGRQATGTASGGLGVAFVRPSAPPVRVVAYDSLGRVIADYASAV